MNQKTENAPVTQLNPVQKSSAAELIFNVFPNYYRIFNPDDKKIYESLSKQLGNTSECEQFFAEVDGDSVKGIVCYYVTTESELKRVASTLELMSICSNKKTALTQLKEFSAGMPAIKENGVYLPFVSVSKSFQGTGVAERLMKAVISWAKNNNYSDLYLYVERTNLRALHFYKKMGFVELDSKHYIPMKLTIPV